MNQQQEQPTAWDAIMAEYPDAITKFFPSLESLAPALVVARQLALLPATTGALAYNASRFRGQVSFTLELNTQKFIAKRHRSYKKFRSTNEINRARGNLVAGLAQASGTPAE